MKQQFGNNFSSLTVSSWMVCHRPYSAGSLVSDKRQSNSHSERSSSVAQSSPSTNKAA